MNSNFEGLKKLQKNMKELGEQQSIAIPELFPPSFIENCSRFKDVQELFNLSGFKIDSIEDFSAIPDEDWDRYIRENTSYPSWIEMQKAGATAWTKKKLGLG